MRPSASARWQAPKERDCDTLVASCSASGEGTALLFNCQMGRGRTTTAMVIASLMLLRAEGVELPPVTPQPPPPDLSSTDAALRRGDYGVVRSLLRVLDGGKQAKDRVDEAIDRCAHMQNLREAILAYRRAISKEVNETRREAALLRGAEYLERYYVLVSFGAYLQSPSFVPGVSSFAAWMHERPELQSILRRMLWRNPMSALAAPSLSALSAELGPSEAAERVEAFIASRSGSVLGAHTILKEEPYPGIQSAAIPVTVAGAANFRQATGHPIYGLAIAPVSAIRAVLERVGAGPGGGAAAVWHNMREEPTVFINGVPYVLRDPARPLGNMQEYTGIGAQRVEEMETRLQADVQAEFSAHSATLVTREAADGQLEELWVPAAGAAVQTPREVYDCLQAEGYSCRYVRIPVTHTRSPRSSDFDALVASIRSTPPGSKLIFSCQAGHGRTTTAMVVAVLLQRSAGAAAEAAARPASASSASRAAGAGAARDERRALQRGEWLVVRRLLRLLQGGEEAKNELDDAIDCCAALINLRECVLQSSEGLDPTNEQLLRRSDSVIRGSQTQDLSHVELQRDALRRGCEGLDRYIVLIAFTAWLRHGPPGVSFKSWKQQRPELRAMRSAVAANPLAALEYSRALEAEAAGGEQDEAVRAVLSRTGAVLAARTILKAHYLRPAALQGGAASLPAQKAAPALAAIVPNFTQATAAGVLVCGMSMPSLPALRALLLQLQAAPLEEADLLEEEADAAQRLVVLTDMREELGLYVKGEFFMLRELATPVVSLKNIGIEGPAAEALERRLKADALAEAARAGGRLLMHREHHDLEVRRRQSWQMGHDGPAATVVPFWAEGVTPDCVLTPREAAQQLVREGYRLQYKRVPITRMRPFGREGAADLDSLRQQLVEAAQAGAGASATYAFTGQTGRGSVGFAMAAACCMLCSEGGAHRGQWRQVARPREQVMASSLELRQWTELTSESRDVLLLMRILKEGPASKDLADWAVDMCSEAGDLRQDMVRLKAIAINGATDTAERTAAAALGLNCIKKYILLVAFCSYCFSYPLSGRDDDRESVPFAAWLKNRPELIGLLQKCRF